MRAESVDERLLLLADAAWSEHIAASSALGSACSWEAWKP
ncbi:MAG: hypothetical protein AVDCRST_MAG18-2872 [uncultured Thermomicrobiales bacterium]|uniref:Uncharacterized protein n=1 Tax=uncultured Thermomicrobiales bacterium TaxID=1645740 RepID=A0A6J4VKW6_9BACT|nr:MAG: hypothetical protein AVDCRST_MAG18-2872 [uncultured Thermomicrobiales bacterium]